MVEEKQINSASVAHRTQNTAAMAFAPKVALPQLEESKLFQTLTYFQDWFTHYQYKNEDLLYKVLFDKHNRPSFQDYVIDHQRYKFPKDAEPNNIDNLKDVMLNKIEIEKKINKRLLDKNEKQYLE